MNVGLFGGTFDPPHNGHLQAALTAIHSLHLDELWWMPAFRPPHKTHANMRSFEARVSLLTEVITLHPAFRVSRIEETLPAPNYTIHTVRKLIELHPTHTFTLIIGSDSLANLPSWKSPDEIRQLVDIAVFERPEYPISSFSPSVLAEVQIIPVDPMSVSSTDIRTRIQNGLPIDEFVPECVTKLLSRMTS